MNKSANQALWSQSLGDLLRRTAKRLPSKPAIICGEVSWSYAEFDEICNRVANSFTARGITVGDKVAILAKNSHAFAAVRFALARLGAVLVPINFMLNTDEVAYILGHSGASMLLVDAANVRVGEGAAKAVPAVKKLIGLPAENSAATPAGFDSFEALLQGSTEPPETVVEESMLAQIIYTSGTESRPKGALLSHSAVIWEYVTCIADAELSEKDVILHALPLYHCAQLDVFLGPGVYTGATNIITAKPTPENLLSMMARFGINSFFAPPTVWISLLRCVDFDHTDLSSLIKGYYGASIMPVEVIREIMRRLPELRLWNLYGQTEIAPVATVLKPEDQLRKVGSAGRPGLNIETRVVNDAGEDVAEDEIGEIVHRSPQLLRGYLNDEERTAAAFVGGWFHSGDLATIDDEGFITVVDRKKDMIKTGGENVSSREVEEVIYQCEGVSEVAVIGLADPKWIEAVTAVVVAKAGASVSEEAIIAFCAEHLAPFKTPKRVIVVDSLPKNPSGKVLKRDLRINFAG
jgi:fatty-acyl-CoA synthase